MLCLASLLITAYGCNTIQGMGRDIERAGETIKDAASD
ncbi:MAG: entericidin A/B family lipoprotein [Desulfohalobiaceae bacterium]|nr:entericidin A/B family lipoprotein [Desulfohalobiaceae bacterium]